MARVRHGRQRYRRGSGGRPDILGALRALRWELGDLWTRDTLSAAAALTIGEAPLLLAPAPPVAELWSRGGRGASGR